MFARRECTRARSRVGREMRERDAFQELNYRAVFGSIAKWATEIDDPARIPELVSRAFYTATSGRPGPVVIALPEDMLTERVAVPDAPASSDASTDAVVEGAGPQGVKAPPASLSAALRSAAYRASLMVNLSSGFIVFGLRISLVPLFVTEGLEQGVGGHISHAGAAVSRP